MLEIADIHVVSKCDRSDANRTLVDLKQMLTLGAGMTTAGGWQIPVVGVSAYEGSGLDDLVTAIAEHRTATKDTQLGAARRARIAAFRLQKTAEDLLLQHFDRAAAAAIPVLADRLAQRQSDPYTAARDLLKSALDIDAGATGENE